MAYKIIDLPDYPGLIQKDALLEVSFTGASSHKATGDLFRKSMAGTYFNFPIQSNQIYQINLIGNNSANSFPPQNQITMMMMTFAQPISIKNLSVNVTGAVAGGLMKIVIYEYSITSGTSFLIDSSPDLNCATTGIKTWAPGYDIELHKPNAFYCIGVIPNVNTINTTGVAMAGVATYWVPSVGTNAVNGIQHSVGSYSVPSSFTTSPNSLFTCPQIYMTLNPL